ncbi:MAG: inorganic phosphate transporter [Bacteroidales bacterium]
METIYLLLVVVLFALAISDLIVGVSNDAVNFLNSAIGAKVAPVRVIMIVAAAGILLGAVFSGGMMEVARKGIFHPEYFYFSEIMIIFLAVMITDVILLDTFNTFGLPTSTTVSIVFELLGAAVAVAMFKTLSDPEAMPLINYINSGKALAIISGILLSVVISFTVGAFVMYLARLVFSFNYKKSLPWFGALWGGISMTAITYFILIKGAKGATFMTDETVAYIKSHTWHIILYSFIGWTVLFQLLTWFTRINILKIIVLLGTGSLAMAFAGNDMVNFIGVPLAGFESYKVWIAHPGADPDGLLMIQLASKVKTPTYFLLMAGVIMLVTLWTSKKARSVTKTSVDLSRQEAGYERFSSTLFARTLVRNTDMVADIIRRAMPAKMHQFISERFDPEPFKREQKALGKEAPSFDLVRASVNLVVASILISFATSLKLPLSTTYVTFMVAMGASLSDKAWGRESAVYRITGVFSVVGGWFLTAFFAFSAAFIVASLIKLGGWIVVLVLVGFAIFFVVRTHFIHRKRMEATERKMAVNVPHTGSELVQECELQVRDALNISSKILSQSVTGLGKDDLKKLRKIFRETELFNEKTKDIRDNLSAKLEAIDLSGEGSLHYVQMVDYMREMGHSTHYMAKPCLDHVDNHHKPILPVQYEELTDAARMYRDLVFLANKINEEKDYTRFNELVNEQQKLLKFLDTLRKKQVKRIKANEVGTRNSLIYLGLLTEIKNLVLQMVNMNKSFRDLYNSVTSDEESN